MRFTRSVVFLFAATLLISRGDGNAPKNAVDERRPLGEQLVDSLKDDNIVAFAQCWVSGKVLQALMCMDPDRSERKDELKRLPKEIPDRDRKIARQFEPLRERLKGLAGDLSQLRLESISGGVEVIRGLVHSYDFGVVVRTDANTLVEFHVAAAAKIGDNWYFMGPPTDCLKVTRRGKSKLVNIMTGNETKWLPAK